jgi:hypothetical protein
MLATAGDNPFEAILYDASDDLTTPNFNVRIAIMLCVALLNLDRGKLPKKILRDAATETFKQKKMLVRETPVRCCFKRICGQLGTPLQSVPAQVSRMLFIPTISLRLSPASSRVATPSARHSLSIQRLLSRKIGFGYI